MKTKFTNEAKTGALVLICALTLLGTLLKVSNFKFFQEGYIVKCKLHYSAGVKKHAPVRLSGVDVGEVRAIHILDDAETQVELDLWIQEGIKIYKDSTAYVTTLGLMGEKYIEIKAGTAAAGAVKNSDGIPGEDPIRLEELFKMGTQVAESVDHMAKDISRVAQSVDQAVGDNRKKLDKIFDNLQETSGNFKDFSEDIKYHPWKILMKGKEKTKEEIAKDKAVQSPVASRGNFNKK